MKPSTLLICAVSYLGVASAVPTASPDDSLNTVENAIENTIEKRACFGSGVTFGGDQNAALKAARTACNSPLKGKYHKGDNRARCYNLASNKHVKLAVGLVGKNAGSTRTLGADECYNGLISEIMKCSHGGETTYGNWRYRADPNAGRC
ncbi:hypothetical protein V494_01357 [Pseudogymnoascus sp. VKM F-4513 (FW-928)]|nr:hypothetical protein V494_01357 [Pseudogymnoascus sp. VKM F-4513 (FW-928)]